MIYKKNILKKSLVICGEN